MNLVHLTDGRLALRDRGVLLAVPPMHPDTPPEDRRRVFELVLRRLYGEAYDVAEGAREAIERRRSKNYVPNLAQLIEERPHHTEKRAA